MLLTLCRKGWEEEEGDGRGKGGVTARALSNFLSLLITFQSRTPIRLTSSTLTHLHNVRRNAAGVREGILTFFPVSVNGLG